MTVPVDKLIRSGRRTLSIEISSAGEVIVRQPWHVSRRTVQDFLAKKSRWIISKKDLVYKRLTAFPQKNFTPGENFLYLGKSYPLKLVDDTEPLSLAAEFRLSKRCVSEARSAFLGWYKQQAIQYLPRRTQQLAQACGLVFRQVKISRALTRWGSCSAAGDINLSWRLVLAPLPVIDYVLIHELAHLLQKGHSPRYWLEVSRMCPDHERHRKWLKENGHLLTI